MIIAVGVINVTLVVIFINVSVVIVVIVIIVVIVVVVTSFFNSASISSCPSVVKERDVNQTFASFCQDEQTQPILRPQSASERKESEGE